MPRGGRRAGAGRPKGAKHRLTEQAISQAGGGLLPLDFMLAVLRDENRPDAERMDAAKAAAPYVHARLSQVDSTVTQKRDVTELTTAELDQLIMAELARGKARKADRSGEADSLH